MQSLRVVEQIAAAAREQHGLLTTGQLRDLKMSTKQIQGWTASGRFERVLPGVLRLAGVPTTREQSMRAAVLWGGPNALVSHRAAGELWGFDGVKSPKPEITLPATEVKRSAIVKVHNTRSPLTDRRTRRGLPVTTPERTLIDLSASLSATQLEIAFEGARLERLMTAESVASALARLGTKGRRGSEPLQRLLHHLASELPAESALEVIAARVLRASDLPKPKRQVAVTASGANYRLDFAWPEAWVALECDGRKWHEMQRDFEDDRRRWSAITAETGYRIVFATWGRLQKEPALIVTQLRQLLSAPVTAAPGSGS